MVPKTKMATTEPEARCGPPGLALGAARPSLFPEPAVSAAKPSKRPPAFPPLASQFDVLLLLLFLLCLCLFLAVLQLKYNSLLGGLCLGARP